MFIPSDAGRLLINPQQPHIYTLNKRKEIVCVTEIRTPVYKNTKDNAINAKVQMFTIVVKYVRKRKKESECVHSRKKRIAFKWERKMRINARSELFANAKLVFTISYSIVNSVVRWQ